MKKIIFISAVVLVPLFLMVAVCCRPNKEVKMSDIPTQDSIYLYVQFITEDSIETSFTYQTSEDKAVKSAKISNDIWELAHPNIKGSYMMSKIVYISNKMSEEELKNYIKSHYNSKAVSDCFTIDSLMDKGIVTKDEWVASNL